MFDDLVELSAADRAQRLSRAKRTDETVAQEAERLLLALETAGDLEPVFVFEANGECDHAQATRLLEDGERVVTPIGTVEIIRLLSDPTRPSMAEVYEARHPDAGPVAIKVLRETGTGYEIRRRFLVETQALRQLDHPNVARLLHAGLIERENASACMGLITRFVPGVPMNEWAGDRSAVEIGRAVSQVARAVHHVHLRQILHRDIKPSNIIMTPEDQPVLLDLGVAKFVGPDRDEFASIGHTVAGTLHYMAPEQLTPSTTPVDYRADIYALGVVLYELLTGRPLIDLAGTSEAEALRLKREVRPSQPKGLSVQSLAIQIALIAASPRADDRYESADKMAEDLIRAIEGRPLMARPLGGAKRMALFIRRHPLPGIASVLMAISLVGGGLVYLVSQQQVAAARLRAEARFDDTREFARWVIFDLTDKLGSLPGTSAARRELIDRASVTLSELAEDPVAGPQLTLELAEAYARLAEVLVNELGDMQQAYDLYESALVLLDRTPDPGHPADPGHPKARLLRVWIEYQQLYSVDTVDGGLNETEVALRSFATLEDLEPFFVNDADFYRWRSHLLTLYSRRQLEAAASIEDILETLDLAVEDGDRAALLGSKDPFSAAQPAHSRFWRAHALLDRRDQRTLEACEEAISVAETIARTGHPLGDVLVSRCMNLKAQSLAQLARMEAFFEQALKAIDTADQAVQRDPNNRVTVRSAEVIRIQLAKAVQEARNSGVQISTDLALDWATQALEMYEARSLRGWSIVYEDAVYPTSYRSLIAALEQQQETPPEEP